MKARDIIKAYLDIMSEEELKTFINEVFLKFVQKQIGFDDVPNLETLEAFLELEYMKEHPEEYKSYPSVEAMMEDILSEEE